MEEDPLVPALRDRSEREHAERQQADGCGHRRSPKPAGAASALPEGEPGRDRRGDDIARSPPASGARSLDEVDQQAQRSRRRRYEAVRRDLLQAPAEAPVERSRLDDVQDVPRQAEQHGCRAREDERRQAPTRLREHRHEDHDRQGDHGGQLRPEREGEGEAGEPDVHRPLAEEEVHAQSEERPDDEVDERPRRLENDHRQRGEDERAEERRFRVEQQTTPDPEDGERRRAVRAQRDRGDESVARSDDHRVEGADLARRRVGVQHDVVRVPEVADRVLLLPEGCPRKVVPERVPAIRRSPERKRRQVHERERDGGGEDRERRIAERVSQALQGPARRRRGRASGELPHQEAAGGEKRRSRRDRGTDDEVDRGQRRGQHDDLAVGDEIGAQKEGDRAAEPERCRDEPAGGGEERRGDDEQEGEHQSGRAPPAIGWTVGLAPSSPTAASKTNDGATGTAYSGTA